MEAWQDLLALPQISCITVINLEFILMMYSLEGGRVMSVTGFHIDDLGSYWQVSEKYKSATKTHKDAVLCG